LREPEVQALLDRARPGWQWEPMLVEIEGERVRIFAGLSLRALRVAQAVACFGSFISKSNSGLLQFLFCLFYIFLLSFVFLILSKLRLMTGIFVVMGFLFGGMEPPPVTGGLLHGILPIRLPYSKQRGISMLQILTTIGLNELPH